MSQLPYLFYDEKAPMTSDHFKELAASLLNKRDAALMKFLSLDPNHDDTQSPSYEKPAPSTGCKFIDEWRNWERTLRLNLAKHRSLHLYHNEEGTVEPPVNPADAYATAAIVYTQDGSPLDGEILLDKARWAAIDLMAGNDYFDRNFAFAFCLKLLLLERRQLFDADSGFSEYKSLYNEIVENSHKNIPGETI